MRLFIRQQPADGKFHLDRALKKRLLRVMRLRPGDHLDVWTSGKKWECFLSEVLPDGIILQVICEIPADAETGLHMILAQAIPKGERFDWLIQKSTELGITEIIPLITERTIVHPDNIDSKLQRWNRIAAEAAGQSENSLPTIVHPPETLSTFIEQPRSGLCFFLQERESSSSLKSVLAGSLGARPAPTDDHITFVVGPEGGWSSGEITALQNAGFLSVHLGPRILRSETAGIVMAAILQYEMSGPAER